MPTISAAFTPGKVLAQQTIDNTERSITFTVGAQGRTVVQCMADVSWLYRSDSGGDGFLVPAGQPFSVVIYGPNASLTFYYVEHASAGTLSMIVVE